MAEADCCHKRRKRFEWKIQYPYLVSDCSISSPSFSIDSCGLTRYNLDFVSKKESDGAHDVSIYLQRHSEPGNVLLDIVITVTDRNINEKHVLKDIFCGRKKIFEKNFSKNETQSMKSKEILAMIAANGLIESNTIVEVDITQHIVSEKKVDLWTCNLEDLESLSSDIAGILNKKKFCDITFKSNDDDRPVRLHKAILASRYPTLTKFLNILETQTEYNAEVDYDGITLLLRYLYSGKISITDSIFELCKLLKRAPLFHLQTILYSDSDYVSVSTSVPLKHGGFILSVPNFNELQNNSNAVNYISCDNFLLWTHLRVVLFIRENAAGERYLALKIQRMKLDGILLMFCRINIIGKKKYFQVYQVNFESERERVISSFIKINRIHEQENFFLKDGTLKLGFDVVLSNLVESSESDSVKYRFPVIDRSFMNLWALRKDISHLYKNSAFSDISIQIDNLKVPAHKVILSARSPVLSRMLEKETEKKIIVFKNHDSMTVFNLLEYMYGRILYPDHKSHEWAFNLYKAAKEYKVAQLKQKCIQFIEENVNPDNVSRVLEFAIECDLASLKEKCQNVYA